jgi:LAO/AO transport system kinase
MPRRRLPTTVLVEGIRDGNRSILARAITLVESRRKADQQQAQQLLQQLLPDTGGATRIGVTGVPGVGKSTFIEALGMLLVEQGHRVAVLAVDPTSALSGGSILGDKTRMQHLSRHPDAFIRPSPTQLSLGGVARRTRESMLLCEAAHFDVILVETVGVGQSETAVAEMVDCFLVLMLPGAGDELQGIKKGILEIADIIAVNKADGDNILRAQIAQQEYRGALQYLQRRHKAWSPQVELVSALTQEGLPQLWTLICNHRAALTEAGALQTLRDAQRLRWMWSTIEERLMSAFHDAPGVKNTLKSVEDAVRTGAMPPTAAADALLKTFQQDYSASVSVSSQSSSS